MLWYVGQIGIAITMCFSAGGRESKTNDIWERDAFTGSRD